MLPRFYTANPLVYGANIIRDEFIIAHIKARRLKVNSAICLFNNFYQWHANIIQINNHNIYINVYDYLMTKSQFNKKIHLIQALIAPSKLEIIIEKANELGLYSVNLVHFQYSNSTFEQQLSKKIQRLQNIIIASSEQCQRNSLLEINYLVWQELIIKLSNLPSSCAKIIFLPDAKDKFKSFNFEIYDEFYYIIGPEGGFSSNEIQQLKSLNCFMFNLGENILKAETAAIVGASFIALNI